MKKDNSKYNENRNAKYLNDKKYRRSVKEGEHKRYAKNNPGFKPKEFGKHAGRAVGFSVEYSLNGDTIMALGITQTAQVLNIKPKALHDWLKTGKFPRPLHLMDNGHKVFYVEEVDALAKILKKDLEGRGSFRPTDTRLINKLFKAFSILNE